MPFDSTHLGIGRVYWNQHIMNLQETAERARPLVRLVVGEEGYALLPIKSFSKEGPVGCCRAAFRGTGSVRWEQ